MSDEEAIHIRACRPGDEPAIGDGFERAFGVTRSLEDWRSKFDAAPHGRAIEVGFDATGELVAHYAALPVAMRRPRHCFLLGGQIVEQLDFTLGDSDPV